MQQRIAESGPLRVSQYVDACLYDPEHGFFTSTGVAGRRGDFLTSSEVGPLFGVVLAQAIDDWWGVLDEPDDFIIIDWGAGPGTLARSILDAEPRCLRAGALRYIAIEISDPQRQQHPSHKSVTSVRALDGRSGTGIVIANELLDNLPFDIARFTADGWRELRVDWNGDEFHLVESKSSGLDLESSLLEGLQVGTEVPVMTGAQKWLEQALLVLDEGWVVAFDYGAMTSELAERGGWLRTHRHHQSGGSWLTDPGSCDITSDVAFDQLRPAPTHVMPQADFLKAHSIEELVAEGAAAWKRSASVGDLNALKGRSRLREAEALLDPEGLGGFSVAGWKI